MITSLIQYATYAVFESGANYYYK